MTSYPRLPSAVSTMGATVDNEYGQDFYEAMERWDPVIRKEVNKDIGLDHGGCFAGMSAVTMIFSCSLSRVNFV
jgi:hypothetical protein